MPDASFVESVDGAHRVSADVAALVRWVESTRALDLLAEIRSRYSSAFAAAAAQNYDEHTHEQHAAFRRYEADFAASLESYLRDELGVDRRPVDFLERLRTSCGPKEDAILRATLACLDYETFAEEMRAHERAEKLAADAASDMGL